MADGQGSNLLHSIFFITPAKRIVQYGQKH